MILVNKKKGRQFLHDTKDIMVSLPILTMRKNKKTEFKNTEKAVKIDTTAKDPLVRTVYKIFTISPDGLLHEPRQFGEDYIFDHYSGYESMRDAEFAILEHCKPNFCSSEYVILPITKAKY